MKILSEIFKLTWNCVHDRIWHCLCSAICYFIR